MTYVRTPAAAGYAIAETGFAPASRYPQSAGMSADLAPVVDAPPVEAPPVGAPVDAETRVRQARYETLDVALDAGRRLFRCWLNPVGRPCFSPELLRDIATMHRSIGGLFSGGRFDPDAPVRYFACSSAIPGIFNLGGDLHLFQQLIAARDLDALTRYGGCPARC